MSEIENLPDGKAKDLFLKLSGAKTVADVRAIRLMVRQAFPDELSDEREELLAYADERLEEVKKGSLPPPVVGGKRSF